MSVSVDKNLKPYDNTRNTSQGLKLLVTTSTIIAGAEQINKTINKKASQVTAQEYLYSIVLGGIVASSIYGACSVIVPMWQEITEYRPYETPFLTASRYLNIHHNRIDDLYS